mmetsp:Transcript_52605/g.125642  ORF Transcript_52605/g.125642 Transcript_52605/m.125642 type:complete len:223 (-) Transcript_52605:632-1300(-)
MEVWARPHLPDTARPRLQFLHLLVIVIPIIVVSVLHHCLQQSFMMALIHLLLAAFATPGKPCPVRRGTIQIICAWKAIGVACSISSSIWDSIALLFHSVRCKQKASLVRIVRHVLVSLLSHHRHHHSGVASPSIRMLPSSSSSFAALALATAVLPSPAALSGSSMLSIRCHPGKIHRYWTFSLFALPPSRRLTTCWLTPGHVHGVRIDYLINIKHLRIALCI